ncbi:hypothetical protein DFP72DRAFT_1069417 [Ephemerocybe angulata]|uniref:Uncharacterized protein n=1 Tax=Ephemerocybe angulata TaxID=980116 RepID=A0A8H6HV69_9AGAR|nr:hypothetical protein DFP72DRAFT_1069417 [Tulosesus angulatus]
MSDDRDRLARRRTAQTHFRTEALLNAAQRGSREHLKRLGKEWPEDISYSKKALIIVFDHLEDAIRDLAFPADASGYPKGARVGSLL